MIINTFTAGDYRSEVTADKMVKVFYNDTMIDNPGPWGDIEGALLWAEAIVGKYSVVGHLKDGGE